MATASPETSQDKCHLNSVPAAMGSAGPSQHSTMSTPPPSLPASRDPVYSATH